MKFIVALLAALVIVGSAISGCISNDFGSSQNGAEEGASVYGVVTDTQGNPISGAVVFIEKANMSEKLNNMDIFESAMKNFTTTDASGKFSVDSEDGNVTLWIAANGYIRARKCVAGASEVNVSLVRKPEGKLTVGHRGANAYAPENTLASFRKAILMGMDMIELDVHMTSDSQLAVIHDDTVDRTTDGTGYIYSMTMEDLKKLDAGSWFNASFTGERIPTLEESLALVKQYGIKVNIEIKTVPMTYPGIEQQVVDMVHSMGMTDQVLISSFSPYSTMYCGLNSDIQCGMLMNFDSPPGLECSIIAAFAEAIHPEASFTTQDLVNSAHSSGLKVNVWTVDDPVDMMAFYEMGCDGIITNCPDVLLDVLTAFALK
ncbi:MAG: glycerophosphodiester phosphodiesterase family protein [Candidatus Thermoplasmatota archaeon]|nr:glycerophosphodiester phosphodiesterase family protein [Candidatus Thermoplasmatota archaeon]